jgi:serine/threonine protein kinase
MSDVASLERRRFWLSQYTPQIYRCLENVNKVHKDDKTVLLSILRSSWYDISSMTPIRSVPPHTASINELYYYIQNIVRQLYYPRYMKTSMRQVLHISGYMEITESRRNKQSLHDGTYSSLIVLKCWQFRFHSVAKSKLRESKGFDARLIGKIVDCYSEMSLDYQTSLCLNAATLSRQVQNRNVNQSIDIIVAPREKSPPMPMGRMCMIQKRFHSDLHWFLLDPAARDIRERASKPEDILNIMMQTTQGLANIHHHQFLHLDIKPSNILCSEDMKEIVLADFGLCVRHTTQQWINGRLVTIWYRPPEMLMAGVGENDSYLAKIDDSVDVWSLGLTLFEVLCQVPLMSLSDVKATPKEEDDEILGYLSFLIELIGKPDSATILSLSLPIHKTRQLMKLCDRHHSDAPYSTDEYRSEQIFRFVHTHMHGRLHKSLPKEMVASLCKLIAETMHWHPQQRPSAVEVFEKLDEIKKKHCQNDAPLVLSPLCTISEEESKWRLENISVNSIHVWWELHEQKLEWITAHTRIYNQACPIFHQNKKNYLDTLVLACELPLRVLYVCAQKGMENYISFTTDQLRVASLSIAMQLTRPWWSTDLHYSSYNMDHVTIMQAELFIVETLGYQLYTENMITNMCRDKSIDKFSYTRLRDTYLDQKGYCDI